MTKPKKQLSEFKTTEENKVVTVEVFYDIGGTNYATGKQRTRGYYISVAPEEVVDSGEYQVRKYQAYSGVVMCIQEAKRFSEKALKELTPDRTTVEKLVKRVLHKNNLTLK
jgi:hypothetical protein